MKIVDYEDAIKSIMNHRHYEGWCMSDRDWAERMLEDAKVKKTLNTTVFADGTSIMTLMEVKDEQSD